MKILGFLSHVKKMGQRLIVGGTFKSVIWKESVSLLDVAMGLNEQAYKKLINIDSHEQ